MDPERLKGIIAFVQSAERLKDTLRTGITAQGRRESTAEHSWRLCLLVMMFAKELHRANHLRLLKLCIVHDLGEAISGDIPAPQQVVEDDKAGRERNDLEALCCDLPADLRQEIMGLWDEYHAAQTTEAVLVKGFDKIETMLQHLIGNDTPDFNYGFNLTYGRNSTDRIPLLKQVRALVDSATQERLIQRA